MSKPFKIGSKVEYWCQSQVTRRNEFFDSTIKEIQETEEGYILWLEKDAEYLEGKRVRKLLQDTESPYLFMRLNKEPCYNATHHVSINKLNYFVIILPPPMDS